MLAAVVDWIARAVGKRVGSGFEEARIFLFGGIIGRRAGCSVSCRTASVWDCGVDVSSESGLESGCG
jgi:hypothetical protein